MNHELLRLVARSNKRRRRKQSRGALQIRPAGPTLQPELLGIGVALHGFFVKRSTDTGISVRRRQIELVPKVFAECLFRADANFPCDVLLGCAHGSQGLHLKSLLFAGGEFGSRHNYSVPLVSADLRPSAIWSKVRPSFSSVACLPVSFCQRVTMTSA